MLQLPSHRWPGSPSNSAPPTTVSKLYSWRSTPLATTQHRRCGRCAPPARHGVTHSGAAYAFQRAVDSAEQAHLGTEPGNEPHWLCSLDDAELAGTIGGRYRELALHDRRQAGHAAEYLARALALRHPARVRLRAFDLVSLARVHLLTGEPELAAATVRTALPFVDLQRPGRLVRRLCDWHREAAPFASNPSVRESRDDIAATTTV